MKEHPQHLEHPIRCQVLHIFLDYRVISVFDALSLLAKLETLEAAGSKCINDVQDAVCFINQEVSCKH